jgi:hypothetical protein
MAANWWEIGKLVDTKPTTKDEEKNWWEIGRVVEEPKKEPQPSVAPEAQPAQGPVGFGPLSLLMQAVPAVRQGITSAVEPVREELTSVFTPETVQGVGANVPLATQLAILSSNLETIDSTMVDSPEKQKAQADTLKQIEDIQRQIQANTPEDLGLLQRGIRFGLENLPAMGVGTIASLAARSPAPALATAGALTRTQSYGQARAEGLEPNLAGTYADINAAIEVGLGAAPTTKLLDVFKVKDAAGLKKKVLEFALTEGVTEQATTALQTLNDLAFQLDQQLANAESPLEAAKIQAERQALTAIATVVGGGTQVAGVAAINKVQRDRLLKQVESGERDLEDIGVEIEQIQIEKAREDALNSAANIAAPTPDEVRTEPGQTEATPFQSSESYAEKIFNSVGQFIPTDTTFKVETKDIDGTQSIVVTDQNGRQYGQAFQNKDQADQLALSLNNLTKSRDNVLKELEPLGTSLKDVLKGYGLNDIGLKLDTKIFGRRGEAMTSEGLFDPVVRQVFLAVDAIDPTGTLNTDQRREALRGVLRHEVVHALRYLDLWKKKEWKTLEKAAANLKKEGTDKTYLDVAKEAYSDQNKVVQVEEAVAEMIRDVADRQAKFAGRPRSLSERAVQFFDRTKNALTGAGFQTYDDVIQRFEQGIVGSRERGQIRTLRAVEERAAEKGQVPERLQRLFTNPEERNKFRQETVQNLQTQKGPVSQPVSNSLNTQGLRESRSFVEPVPEKIQVGDRSVGTRDSEGRLIYSGYEGPEVFGIQTRPTQEGLQNFWNWFGTSKTTDKQGRPLVFYHGTAADITAFRPKQAGSVFVTRSPEFAEEFGFLSDNYMVSNFPDFMSDQQVLEVLDETLVNPASFSPKFYDQVAAARDQAIADVQAGKAIRPAALKPLKDIAADGRSSRYLNAIQKRLPSSANMIPVYVKADKPWDYQSKDDVKAVVRRARDNGADITASMVEEIGQGNWQTIEGSEGNAPILDAIRELGYDSMYVEEQGEKNLAVFDPSQVKSAIGNTGDFSPTTPSIRESRRSGSEAFENKLIEDMRVPDFKSKEKLIEMNIDDFLNLAKQGYMPAKAKDISDLAKEGKKFTSLPFLQVSLNNEGVLKVVGHEGRHRARFLRDTGYQSIPVVLKTLDPNSIRWSEQDNPRSFDYVDNWPTRIEAQEGSFSIPMPVSREQSMVPYGAKGVRESRKPIQVRMPRIPGVMEDAPILPIGDVEQSLIDLFKQTNSPTSEQLAQIPGAPTKRSIKNEDGKVIDDPRDTEVRPISMDELREMARIGLRNSEDVLWYMQFGTGLSDIVGPANLGEASVIFGITSQQNSAEQNVADTLHIMRLAREIDPVANPKKFENAVRNKPRPDGQRLKITGDQINRIIRLYKEGFAEAGLKTSTYMQLIQDRAANRFNPFSVQDVHMARVYGFRRKERDPKSGNLVDGAKIPGDLQYRYAQFLTSKLAEEFGVSPDRMQAALWFYAKTKLSPKEKGGKPGTWKSASSYSQPEIDYINGMVEKGEFDKNQALTPALREGVRPQNAIKTVIAPYSNTAQAEQLLELARQRAPTALVSATPGNARGYGFPDGTPMELITQFNRDAIGAITDQDGQIPFLRELGIPHEVRLGYGTYGVLEPNIQIKLLGGTPQQAKIAANILGDALLQDAAIFGQPTQKADRVNNFGVAVTKADRSEFTPDELAKIADAVNPTKATDDGINFTLIQPNVLSFLDSRSFGDGYEADNMLPEFHGNITSLLPSDMNFEAVVYTQEGDYFGHQDYKSRIEEAWNSGSLGGSSGIFQRINDSLYQPFWNEYTRFREANNLGPAGNPRPESFVPAAPVVPAVREAKRKKPKEGAPLGPPNPGPETDFDTTAAAEALNNSQPVDQMGIPAGPLVTDTMPDNTVDISRARLDPLMKRLITGVEFFQSAPDKLRSGVGLTDIAKRIEDYYDTYAERLGIVNSIIRDANKNIRIGGNKSALETFERFIRARENNRADEAAAIKAEASDSDRQLIDAWEKIAEETGRVNLSVRTPNGQPMKVYDPNLVTGTYGEKVGGFRPIKAVKQFFPRTMRREVLEVMMNPDTDPALYNELLDALVASGRAETTQEAEDYLVREYFSDEVKQDYFAGVEKARTDPLPEIFYDYSWDAATRYLRKWARRTSQIQYFGQEMGEFQKDWFDTNIKKVRDRETQEYLNEIKNRIYEIESFGFLTNIASWFNSIATGTMLGNPISASLNLLGGTTTNVQEFGIRQVAKSYLELLTDWKQIQKEGTTLGILNTDFLNILSDHVERDGGKYFSQTEKVSEALAKFTNVMLTFGGFNGAENVVRASALLAAKGWLNDSLKAVNENPNSSKAKKFYEWVRRENLDADKLILENGAGEETGKFLRRAVNVPQGSYKIDMTPVFIDTIVGRTFFKYQKFGTQINRFFYRHFLKPFIDKPSPATFLRTVGFLGSAVVGGGAILALREAFGYGDPGPDDEEIKKAFENEDTSRGWALLFSRVWQNIMAAGSAGNFGNYLQFGLDWQDQLRPKNPLSPPALASVENFVDFINKIRDQKGINARDIDETLEASLSFYRAFKRIGLAGLDTIGVDAKEVKRFASRKEVREIREISRRYSDEMELEYKRRVAPGAVVRTPMSPVNREVVDALYAGDGARARAIIREAQKGLPRKERERVLRSVQSSVRNAQPIQIAGVSPSKEIRRDFDRWAKENLPAEKVQLIKRVDRNYRRAARMAGLKIGD